MHRGRKDSIIAKFNKLDFHDDVLTAVRIHPSRTGSNFTRIEFELLDNIARFAKVLSFRSCANFRFVADFDVLTDNSKAGNTWASTAKGDAGRMKRFVKAQISHWRTAYMPPMPKDKPIRKKLKSIEDYILFRLSFFGGTAEVLAKKYRLSR
jgi:hypothetical protein